MFVRELRLLFDQWRRINPTILTQKLYRKLISFECYIGQGIVILRWNLRGIARKSPER